LIGAVVQPPRGDAAGRNEGMKQGRQREMRFDAVLVPPQPFGEQDAGRSGHAATKKVF